MTFELSLFVILNLRHKIINSTNNISIYIQKYNVKEQFNIMQNILIIN
jgi:hypothetical protein